VAAQALGRGDRSFISQAGVAAIAASSGRRLGILEFITGAEEIFDVLVLPDICCGEILTPCRRFGQHFMVNMKAARGRRATDGVGTERPDVSISD
jgi:hypothetical protein